MFENSTLKNHLQTSSTIKTKSVVLAEWNMNMPDNIFKVGNYRVSSLAPNNTPIIFDPNDFANAYTNATDSDVVIDGGFDDSGVPQTFTSKKEKMKMIYSLEDCIKPFRPRSGINKASYFNNRYLQNSGADMFLRPRYYMPSRFDKFRYWTSYRTEGGKEYGTSTIKQSNLAGTYTEYLIEDACPFVVYKDVVPANRIVIKMQTNVSDINLGTFKKGTTTFSDPFFGESNKTVPNRWKIQYLDGNNWVDAYSFQRDSTREDGSPIVGTDGYVELEYGLIVPEKYKNIFIFAEKISSTALLPDSAPNGYAYLVTPNESSLGTFYIYTGAQTNNGYETFIPQYGWTLGNESVNRNTSFVTDFTSPASFINPQNGKTQYREFSYIRGIRVVVYSMKKYDSTFDLIEMSPRLIANISDKVIGYKVTKQLSDIGQTSMPVGQLLASTGNISIFDDDLSFNLNNSSSIISKYTNRQIKFVFYEGILDVDNDDYYIPIKTLYSENVPQTDYGASSISIELRDLYFLLESMTAPRMLVTQASLSYAISTLLDSIGFSNYVFKRLDGETDPVIPYFFIPPDKSVAEVLNDLAVATQSAMFFDEYNNFVVMTKNYMMPPESGRQTDFTLVGSDTQEENGITKNFSTSQTLPTILSIASENKQVYNDGKINYTERYIQRTYGSYRQQSNIDQDKTWMYKPVLLWEVSGTEEAKTVNEVASQSASYQLSAVPLNFDLSSTVPYVSNGIIMNNTFDIGENVYYLTRYKGYFYANGEVIKYDAVQFNITLPVWYPILSNGKLDETKPEIVLPGKLAPSYIPDSQIFTWRKTHAQGSSNVWISSNQEYQKYFGSLPFNGKIYATGLVRIYTQPYYTTATSGGKTVTVLKNGPVEKHGRGQFGTTIVSHSAGLSSYWSDPNTVRGCDMESQYLFTTEISPSVPTTSIGSAGKIISGTTINSDIFSRSSIRSGIIKNFMANSNLTDTQINLLKSTQSGTIQSSALILEGPSFSQDSKPINFVSYVYKALDNKYKNFGTRMRIVGKIENNLDVPQTAIGSSTYYTATPGGPSSPVTITGGSGGLAVMLNPETNNGYYFEIIALNNDNIEQYLQKAPNGEYTNSISNVVFYKVVKEASSNKAIPVKLWGGLAKIITDDGQFVGQYRIAGEENPTVYDLSIEYQDIGKTRRFYLYLNNKLIKVVDDTDPLPIYNNMALFSRGSSRCMFENIYALTNNYAQNTVATAVSSDPSKTTNISDVFGDVEIDITEALRKYAMSGFIQATYMTGISSQQPPQYNIYFDEFGTILRECAYFDIRYNRSYPALYAKISPAINNIKGYAISGFNADSYGAEFLIFNTTDTILNLDETSGNFLRINGISFTQETSYELTVDEYFNSRADLSDPEMSGTSLVISPVLEQEKFNRIKQSRMIYGKKEFSIESNYIQTQDDARALMGWLIDKAMSPKQSVGVNIFSMPILQLGDIVNIDYKSTNNVDVISPIDKRFVIYNIEYSRDISGPNMTLYLSEV